MQAFLHDANFSIKLLPVSDNKIGKLVSEYFALTLHWNFDSKLLQLTKVRSQCRDPIAVIDPIPCRTIGSAKAPSPVWCMRIPLPSPNNFGKRKGVRILCVQGHLLPTQRWAIIGEFGANTLLTLLEFISGLEEISMTPLPVPCMRIPLT